MRLVIIFTDKSHAPVYMYRHSDAQPFSIQMKAGDPFRKFKLFSANSN